MNYLQQYAQFTSVKEMDEHVQRHIEQSFNKITNSTRKVLYAIAGRSLRFIGASHLKIETIAKDVSVSDKTVGRAIKKLVELGILEKFNSTKKNGIKGANIYSILPFVPSDVPSVMSERVEAEKPCNSNVKGPEISSESINLLITNKTSLKNITYQTDGAVSNLPVVKETEKPVSLRQKIAHQLKARGLSLTTLNEFAKIGYGQITKLVKQDASIPKSYAEELVYKKFLYVLDRKSSRNPFGLFSSIVEKEFAKLLGQVPEGEQCELELQAKCGIRFRPVPEWKIEQEEDPARKARLIKNNEIARQQMKMATAGKKVGVVTDWYKEQKEQEAKEEAEKAAIQKAEQENAPQIDFETERLRLLELLNN